MRSHATGLPGFNSSKIEEPDQFEKGRGIEIKPVNDLKTDWEVVNIYSDYNDFQNNFTKEQR